MPLTLGLGPFRVLARALAVLTVLEAVLLWSAPEATVIMWHEGAARGGQHLGYQHLGGQPVGVQLVGDEHGSSLAYKNAFHEAQHHRRHFALLLAVSGGFSLLHAVGAGAYTLGGWLKKRA